ncbi:MAG TPA: 4-amino-4-deoxy-L-arabinose transferase, partial [Coleofasciculaceae cyanobacterium]
LYIFSQARLGDRQPLQPYSDYFQALEPVAALPLYRGGVAIDEIQVYLAKNLLKPFPRPYGH